MLQDGFYRRIGVVLGGIRSRCYKMELDGPVSSSEAFDPDDPPRMDRYPEYDTDKHLGDRPPTPTQQRDARYKH